MKTQETRAPLKRRFNTAGARRAHGLEWPPALPERRSRPSRRWTVAAGRLRLLCSSASMWSPSRAPGRRRYLLRAPWECDCSHQYMQSPSTMCSSRIDSPRTCSAKASRLPIISPSEIVSEVSNASTGSPAAMRPANGNRSPGLALARGGSTSIERLRLCALCSSPLLWRLVMCLCTVASERRPRPCTPILSSYEGERSRCVA